MNISKFFGVTNREAMRQVRLALGADALIISNKRVNGGVEVLAADPTELEAGDIDIAADKPVNLDNADLKNLIGDLKGSLEERFNDLLWSNQLRDSNHVIALFQNLLRCGFSTSLLRAMLKVIPKQDSTRSALKWARAELIKHLPVLTSEDQFWHKGMALALVGPTGVGKTTTLAKLAARFVKKFGAENLVLITTDTYRIGAHEQLKIYGDLLNVPVHVVKDSHELKTLMQTIRADQTVLIDNMGISQRDKHIGNQATLLASAGRDVSRLLVLNAASHGDTLDEVVKTYSHDGGSKLLGCIVSKTDEATKLGAVIDIAIRYKLKIHFVSNGQKVPENLLLLGAADLVDKAIYSQTATANLYAPSEADLSALLSVAKPEQNSSVKEQQRRQNTLLPKLLSNYKDDKSLALTDLQAAIKLIDNDQLLADTYDLWLAKTNNRLAAAAGLINHYRSVANSLASGIKLVVHNRQSLNHNDNRGLWLSSACFNNNGLPLASLNQQIGFSSGWYTTSGVMSKMPAAQAALLNQIQNENFLLEGDCLHVFDGSSQDLIRKLSENNINYLAAINARIKVYINQEEYILSAWCKQLELKPLHNHNFDSMLNPAGLKNDAVTWWFGSSPAQLLVKGRYLAVQVFYLHAINNSNGKLVRSWYGVANQNYGASLITKALILRQEYQSVLRSMVLFLDQDETTTNLLDRAFYAAQSGLAAWHLSSSAGLMAASHIAANMLGQSNIGAKEAYKALIKLFTLKELLN